MVARLVVVEHANGVQRELNFLSSVSELTLSLEDERSPKRVEIVGDERLHLVACVANSLMLISWHGVKENNLREFKYDFKRTAFAIWKPTVSPALCATSAAAIRSGRHAKIRGDSN